MRKSTLLIFIICAALIAGGAYAMLNSESERNQKIAAVDSALGSIDERIILGNEEPGSVESTKLLVCWGDSMTEGIGVSKATIYNRDGSTFDASYLSYPEVLSQLTGITTLNFGMSGATSTEIAKTQALLTEFVKSGRIAQNRESEIEKPIGKTVESNVERQKERQQILILEIGSNGGWDNDYSKLIAQYDEIIKSSGCTSYLILGDTDDPGSSIGDVNQGSFEPGDGPGETNWEAALRKQYGDHFVNVRVFLIEHGLETVGIAEQPEDAENASIGCIPSLFRSDWTHLNSYGYYAKAVAIYKQGVKLGYWS